MPGQREDVARAVQSDHRDENYANGHRAYSIHTFLSKSSRPTGRVPLEAVGITNTAGAPFLRAFCERAGITKAYATRFVQNGQTCLGRIATRPPEKFTARPLQQTRRQSSAPQRYLA